MSSTVALGLLHFMIHTCDDISIMYPAQELSIVNDDILTWQLKLWRFDEDCEGGRNLNRDLQKLAARLVEALHALHHMLK